MPELEGSYHCPQCGYDLRGQTVDRCPECGLHYDTSALEHIVRESFHQCIGAFLRSFTPLVVSIALLLGYLLRRIMWGLPCIAFASILLTPLLVHQIENWVLSDTPTRRRRDRWAWDIESLLIPGGATMTWGLLLLVRGVTSIGPVVSTVSGGLLLWGAWRGYAGIECLRQIRTLHQDSAMPPHRLHGLERACRMFWILSGAGGALWLAVLCM